MVILEFNSHWSVTNLYLTDIPYHVLLTELVLFYMIREYIVFRSLSIRPLPQRRGVPTLGSEGERTTSGRRRVVPPFSLYVHGRDFCGTDECCATGLESGYWEVLSCHYIQSSIFSKLLHYLGIMK